MPPSRGRSKPSDVPILCHSFSRIWSGGQGVWDLPNNEHQEPQVNSARRFVSADSDAVIPCSATRELVGVRQGIEGLGDESGSVGSAQDGNPVVRVHGGSCASGYVGHCSSAACLSQELHASQDDGSIVYCPYRKTARIGCSPFS